VIKMSENDETIYRTSAGRMGKMMAICGGLVLVGGIIFFALGDYWISELSPAEKNNAIPPTANIIGVANLILPFHIVARKLKTCIAEAGTAANVPTINTVFSVNDIPVANM
jgi:hypothetical protein